MSNDPSDSIGRRLVIKSDLGNFFFPFLNSHLQCEWRSVVKSSKTNTAKCVVLILISKIQLTFISFLLCLAVAVWKQRLTFFASWPS